MPEQNNDVHEKILPLKRAVIKEELVALTGDYTKAVILNQFIYWLDKMRDFDKFILEERQRKELSGEELNINITYGWIYKKAEEIAEEIMMPLAKSTIREHIKFLVGNGWLDERTNPYEKWDKTLQYRVNLVKICKDLYKLNYMIQGYKFDFSIFMPDPNKEKEQQPKKKYVIKRRYIRGSESELPSSETKPRDSNEELRDSDIKLQGSSSELRGSNVEPPNELNQTSKVGQRTAIPYNTIDITIDNTVYNISDILNKMKKYINSNSNLTSVAYNTWIEKLSPISISETTIVLGTESEFNIGILQDRYVKYLKEAAISVTEKDFEIKFIVDDNTNKQGGK